MKFFTILFFLVTLSLGASAAELPIELADHQFKMKGREEQLFYYGFSQGDQLVFSFEVVNGAEIGELEISEYPSNSKFMACKTAKIERKLIVVAHTAIYRFRVKNSSFFERVCKFKIERVPASFNSWNFNSAVSWRTVQDTLFSSTAKSYLVKCDTLVQTLVDRTLNIKAAKPLFPSSDKELVEFNLPAGTASWSYFIGVENEAENLFVKTKFGIINTAATLASNIPVYGSMAALALYGVNAFQMVQGVDNVEYAFLKDYKNALAFTKGDAFVSYQKGKVLHDAAQMKAPLSGKIYLGLQNRNLLEAIQVKLNVTAVVIHKKWGLMPAKVISVSSQLRPFLK